MIAVILIAGVLLDYVLVLVLGKLGLSLFIGSVLAILGLFIALWTSQVPFLRHLRNNWIAVCIVLYLALLYGFYILFEPISACDARSIWFFHGKIIFYDHAFRPSAVWTEPAVQFTHIAYPKLVSVLAAQFAYIAGFWNEYFPKAALLAILIPALFALQSFIRVVRISSFLLLAYLFSLGWWLWNGYMDGYLAIYALLSVLFFGRWLEEMDAGDLYAGIICLGMLVNLKDEGLLFALVVSVILVALRFTLTERKDPETCVSMDLCAWVLIVLSSLGLIIWYLLKWQWGIRGSTSFIKLHLIPVRLTDGSLITIIETLLLKNGIAKALGIFIVSLILAKFCRLRTPLSAWLGILTSLVYFSGMFTVYLATSHDLTWHLSTSSERTMLPVLLVIFSATFIIVQRIETSGSVQGIPPQKPSAKRKRQRLKK